MARLGISAHPGRVMAGAFLLLFTIGAGVLPCPGDDLLDASGTADVVVRLERDHSSGRAFLPRQELDQKALLRRFEELFKAFSTRNQQVERQYYDQYPLIYVPGSDDPVSPGGAGAGATASAPAQIPVQRQK